ncbi:NADP-dependent oxidoreductase (plasmid) [Sphingobium sp. SJ10-10]|uniref:NADP-dependent oxidoreductase n=1 Tax=Sphingobium sp. SJ10-10 TaxID=3114999 RepID=UPI002E1875CE|nr:NADP-dependent oxidoreductase [Sphingobium sp. SJ10-10]
MDTMRMTLKDYPDAAIDANTFAAVSEPLRPLEEGEALFENIYATVDPAQSRRLRRYENYVPSFRPGDLIAGLSLGRVIQSRSPLFVEGDYWTHWSGWETHSIVRAPAEQGPLAQRADPAVAALTDYLGPLGGKGITAWIGMKLLGAVKPGDTVLISAAAGAVGGIAGQLARAYGASRIVGIAGGPDKCRHLIDTLGYDAAIDRHAGDIDVAIDRKLPDGIDMYLDNVGGPLQAVVMERMRRFGRFVITGTVAEYGLDVPPPGPNLFVTVRRGFSIHGYLATQYYDRFAEFRAEMHDYLASGQIKAGVDIVEGLDQAGEAMAGMLAGDNIGQRLIRIATDPTL